MTPWLRNAVDLARQRVLERALPDLGERGEVRFTGGTYAPTSGPKPCAFPSVGDCLPDEDHYCCWCGRELEG